MAQRISRAKQRIKASGAEFRLPSEAERPERLAAVLQVLYLIFNEGYTASSGAALHRAELAGEAIRLTRQLHQRLPTDGEVAGLLALCPHRRPPPGAHPPRRHPGPPGRAGPHPLGPRGHRRRGRPDHPDPGLRPDRPLPAPGGHRRRPRRGRHQDTDWEQILALYEHLHRLAPGPMVELNRIVAVAMVHGPETALRQLEPAEADPALTGHHRLDAVRAHLLELAGDEEGMGRPLPGRPPHPQPPGAAVPPVARGPALPGQSPLIGRSSNTGWPWPRRRSEDGPGLGGSDLPDGVVPAGGLGDPGSPTRRPATPELPGPPAGRRRPAGWVSCQPWLPPPRKPVAGIVSVWARNLSPR